METVKPDLSSAYWQMRQQRFEVPDGKQKTMAVISLGKHGKKG